MHRTARLTAPALGLALPLLLLGCTDKPTHSHQPGAATLTKDQVKRLSPQQVHAQVKSGALLVCSYGSDDKCARFPLAGSTPPSQFEKARATLPKDKPLIFFCA